MSSKFLIKSFDRRFLLGILALIFMLIMILSDVTLSQENQAGKQEVLHKASLRWMQVGMQQYQSNQFTDAELSFRRARVFKKYLTTAEREQLDEYLANARNAIIEGKPAIASSQPADESVEPNQPVKAEVNAEKVKDSRLPIEEGRQQAAEGLDKISGQPSKRKEKSVDAAEPGASEIQAKAESTNVVVLVDNGSLNDKLMQLSSWLTENRRNILMVGLPLLAVLVIISRLKRPRIKPGRRIYTDHVPASSSFIGSRLNDSGENRRSGKGSKKARSAPAAAPKPKRKSFTQSTEHWKKEPVGLTLVPDKSFRTDENWPQQKDKFETVESVETIEDEKPAAPEPQQKQCTRCKQMKDLSEFYKNKSTRDGLARWCKECKKEYRKNHTDAKK